MGLPVRLVVYALDEESAERACRAAFARVAEIDRAASDYLKDSELNQLCAKAGGGPVPIGRDLYTLLERSQQLAEKTRGAFDVTVGPYVAIWREARRTKRLPEAAALEQARRLVGWQNLRLDAVRRTAELTTPGMKLDLGGIAKGYAGDCAIAELRRHGIAQAMFEAGGDIVLGDPPPDQSSGRWDRYSGLPPGWRVSIPHPNEADGQTTLVLANCAISTSGDLEQHVEIDGKRYSHVVDPRTGLGLTGRVLATVTAPDGITADSVSTAACVLGAEQARAVFGLDRRLRLFIRTD